MTKSKSENIKKHNLIVKQQLLMFNKSMRDQVGTKIIDIVIKVEE
jgi:hypothetical protein